MNCLTCQHINNLKIVYENTGNFTHVIHNGCPYLSKNCCDINFDGSLSKFPILIDIKKCQVWVDAGLSTEHCKGHKDYNNIELIKSLLENVLRDHELEYTNLKFDNNAKKRIFKGFQDER